MTCVPSVPRSLSSISSSFAACAKVLQGGRPLAFPGPVFPQPAALTAIQETIAAHKSLWKCFGAAAARAPRPPAAPAFDRAAPESHECYHVDQFVKALPEGAFTPVACALKGCAVERDLTVCLTCHVPHCWPHAFTHKQSAFHPVALSLDDTRVFCFTCASPVAVTCSPFLFRVYAVACQALGGVAPGVPADMVAAVADVADEDLFVPAGAAAAVAGEEEEDVGGLGGIATRECPHVASSCYPLPPEVAAAFGKAPCGSPACSITAGALLCLACHAHLCRRDDNGHMGAHVASCGHPLSISPDDLGVWCYECDSYVDPFAFPQLFCAYAACHLAKFGCLPPVPAAFEDKLEVGPDGILTL